VVLGRIFEGSPREIAEKIEQVVGDRRISVLLMDEMQKPEEAPRLSDAEFEAIMAELHELAVSVPHVDDSREGIYNELDRK
jgi:hypothetical protein